MVWLNRMAWFDCETGPPSEPWTPSDPVARATYREQLRSRLLDHEVDEWPSFEKVDQALDIAEQKLWKRCEARGFMSKWRVDVVTRWPAGWSIHRGVTFGPDKMAPSAGVLTIEVDPRLLWRLLTRQEHWNNAEVGSLLTFRRTPDVYDVGTFTALSYLHV